MRCPSDTTPSSRRSPSVRVGSRLASISLSQNARSYWPSPRPSSHALMLTTSPLQDLTGCPIPKYTRASGRGLPQTGPNLRSGADGPKSLASSKLISRAWLNRTHQTVAQRTGGTGVIGRSCSSGSRGGIGSGSGAGSLPGLSPGSGSRPGVGIGGSSSRRGSCCVIQTGASSASRLLMNSFIDRFLSVQPR